MVAAAATSLITPTGSSTTGASSFSSSVRRPRTTRITRTGGPGGDAVVVARPPVLLEIVSHSVVYAGFVGQARAQHLLRIPSNNNKSCPESFYRQYAAVLLQALHLLGDVKERRVVVAADFMGPNAQQTTPRAWQQAVQRILLHDAKAPACSFHASLSLVPMSLPPTQSTNGMLVVQLTLTEVHCMAHAQGQALHYTYQSVVVSPSKETKVSEQTCSSLVRALLQCLEACPSHVRRAVAHNIFFVGAAPTTPTESVPSLAIRVVKQLREVLRKGTEVVESASDDAESEEPTTSVTTTTEPALLPVHLKALQPLAENVSVIQLSGVRPDLIPWLGASVWARHWHGVDPLSSQFHWITTAATNKSTTASTTTSGGNST